LAADVAALPLVVDSTTGNAVIAAGAGAVTQMIKDHSVNVDSLAHDVVTDRLTEIIRGGGEDSEKK
jgi:hypothetical protein